MHVHFLDPFIDGRSPIHALDARVKLVLTLAFILVTSLMPMGAWAIYILLFALAVCVVMLSEIGVGYVLKRAGLAIPFALAALPLVFTAGGKAWFSFSLGGAEIVVSQTGLVRLLSILFKSYVSMQMAIVLASTTPFPQLLQAMRAIKIPKLLVAIFGLMWRYLFVLADEAMRLIRGRDARSGASSDPNFKTGGSVAWRAKTVGGMAGNLFMRSFERGDRIYNAMASRGYDGEVRVFALPELRANHIAILVAGSATLIALLILSRVLY
jgi:cobalt/nickel transport system permease protein